eukprot:249023_1
MMIFLFFTIYSLYTLLYQHQMKRKLNTANIRSKKRRKFNTNDKTDRTDRTTAKNKIRSNLFCDECDQKQFQMIYQSLQNCKSINFIPSCVIYTISEFATGTIEKCDNYKKCQNDFLLLNQNKFQSNKQNDFSIFYFELDPHIYIPESDEENTNKQQLWKDKTNKIQLFCNECTKHLKGCLYWYKYHSLLDGCLYDGFCWRRVVYDKLLKCDCGRDIILCSRHTLECKDCKVLTCYDSLCTHYWECGQCSRDYCSQTQKSHECESCEQTICNDCIERICCCDHQWTHEECIGTLDSNIFSNDLGYCDYCKDIVCWICEYNEPKKYKCNNCMEEYEYKTICGDCQNDNEICCEWCYKEINGVQFVDEDDAGEKSDDEESEAEGEDDYESEEESEEEDD